MAAPPPPPIASFETSPSSLLREISETINSSKAFHDTLARTLTPATATFHNLIAPLRADVNHAARRIRPLTLLARVSPDPQLREAARDAEAQLSAAETAALIRTDIAELVAAVFERSDDTLDRQDRHLLATLHGDYQRSGACIRDPSTRAKLKDLKDQLDEVRTLAKKSLTEDHGAIWFARSELEGVPERTLQQMEQRNGGDELLVTLRKGQITHVMRSAVREETRRAVYEAKERRFPENVGRLTEILRLRHEIAQLLGFDNHAVLKMEERMHDGVSDVLSVLDRTRSVLKGVAETEIDTLLRLKRETDPMATELYSWDWDFYNQKLKNQEHQFDSNRLSEYFEVKNTLSGMLGVFQELFGLEFRKIDAPTWHQDVLVYEVWNSANAGGALLGYFYVDLFSRDGKVDGACHGVIHPGFTDSDGVRHIPVSALVYNFLQHPSKPSLLQHNEIKTLFHELGHGIHHIVSRTKYGLSHSRDFVEIPSVMLENFIWVPDILVRLSKHYNCLGRADDEQEGKLPRDLADAVARTKNVNAAHDILMQIRLSLFDLAIHAPENGKPPKDEETTCLWNKLIREVTGLQNSGAQDNAGQGGFPHIYKSYDAGYFGYVTSRLYAADLYRNAFAADPLNGETGQRYRRLILQPGAGVPEAETLKAFLGRMPNSDAYYEGLLSQNQCS